MITEREKTLLRLMDEMMPIVSPGEFGLGTEPESIPEDDKKAWERVGQLLSEMWALFEDEDIDWDEVL